MNFLTLWSFIVLNALQWHYKTYPSTVSIGDEIHSVIWVRPNTDGTVGYYFNVTNPVVILKNRKIISGKNEYKIYYTYSIFSTQPVTISGIGFRWTPKKGKEKIYTFPPLKIGIRLITKPGDKPFPQSNMKKILLFNWDIIILLGLFLLLGIVLYILKKHFEKEEAKKVVLEETVPPEIVAERRLNELLTSKFYQNKRWKEFFLQLTEITKDYLAGVFNFLAPAETTFEIITEMKVKKITSSDLNMIRVFFEKSDLIKFAKHQPSDDEVNELLDMAKKIIKLGMKYHGV